MTEKEFRIMQHNEVANQLINTTRTYDQLADEYGISNHTVYEIAKARGIGRKKGVRPKPKKVKVAPSPPAFMIRRGRRYILDPNQDEPTKTEPEVAVAAEEVK